MTQSNCVESFLSIARVGIGKASPELTLNADWQAIKALADKQGLTAIIIDGIEQLSDTKRPPKDLYGLPGGDTSVPAQAGGEARERVLVYGSAQLHGVEE